uniref:C-type lectin domain-containing protein n=1 Tax=Gopherus evgoodei TaxID=1825980 RepID=A0A8C4W073_9SAUR
SGNTGTRQAPLEVNPPLARSDPPAAARCCPDGWVGYGGKCYYFSEAEGDWNNSQSNCSSFSASLAEIDTPQEMAFIKRHKDLSEHWIGLRREPVLFLVNGEGGYQGNWLSHKCDSQLMGLRPGIPREDPVICRLSLKASKLLR